MTLSLKGRESLLNQADRIRRLNDASEARKAALMHRGLSGQIDDILRRPAAASVNHAYHAQGALLRNFAQATHPQGREPTGQPKARPKPKAAPSVTANAPGRRKTPTKQKPPKGYTELDRRRHTKKGPPRYVAV
jgi:hypothetical protein